MITNLRSEMFRQLQAGVASAPAPALPPAPAHITLADDAYHFALYEHHSHVFWYVEWWYFNFVDHHNNLSGMITFGVANPKDMLDLGVTGINAAILRTGADGVLTKTNTMPISDFHAESDKANVTVGDNTLRVQDANTYVICAASSDGEVRYDLTYTQADAPQLLASNVKGYHSWEISSWLVYMPSATVSGAITIGGTTYTLQQATGYHDHDWGMWALPLRVWSWAQFSSPAKQLSFDVGFHAAFQKSTAYFRYQDLRLYFNQDTFLTSQSDWVSWHVFWEYPTQVRFQAIDTTSEYKLDLRWAIQETAALEYFVLIFEQTARFTGALSRRDATAPGGWKPILDIDELGFSEYTRRWIGDDG